MPQEFVSLVDQLNTQKIKDPLENYKPLWTVPVVTLKVNGSGTPQDQDIDLAAVQALVANSPAFSAAVLEITLRWAAASINLTTFANLAALTTGIDVKMVKEGTAYTIGNIKTLQDLYDKFDEVTITSDDQATPNRVLKARKLFTEQDGLFQHLVAATDAFRSTVNDDLSTLTFGQMNIQGYAFVPN